jgi:hypothetical protein
MERKPLGPLGPITQDALKRILHYDPDTGVFSWIVSRGRMAKAGNRAGIISDLGYRKIKISGRRHYAGRLAWLYMTGSPPEREIDHINGIRDDDRFENLREATRWQNNANRIFKPNRTGSRGVAKTGKTYWARLGTKYLGSYKTRAEAQAAYETEASVYFGDRARASKV